MVKRKQSTSDHQKSIKHTKYTMEQSIAGLKKEKSDISLQSQEKTCITSKTLKDISEQKTKMVKKKEKRLYMSESQVTNKKKISKDKKTILKKESEDNTELSKTLEVDSTTKGEDIATFLNPSWREMSRELWLPTETESVDLDTKSSNKYVSLMKQKSWFSINKTNQAKKSSRTISYQYVPISQQKVMEVENMVKTRKIKLKLTKAQKKTLSIWMKGYKKTYNLIVKKQTSNNYIFGKKELREYCIKKNSDIFKEFPFLNMTPSDIRDKAVLHYISSFKTNKDSGKEFKMKTKKWYDNTIEIDSRTFERTFGRVIYKDTTNSNNLDEVILKGYEDLFVSSGSVRITKDRLGDFYISILYDQNCKKENQYNKYNAIALDPGVRKFLTGYDTEKVIEFCNGDFVSIEKKLKEIDIIQSKISHTKNSIDRLSNEIKVRGKENYKFLRKIRSKLVLRSKRLDRALHKKIKKVKDMRDDMHKKVCHYLVSNYNQILLPHFNTSNMLPNLGSKTSRAMSTWSHFSFKMRLRQKCIEKKVTLHEVHENYTSQICGRCLHRFKTSLEEYSCPICGLKIDRDALASRNIFIMNCRLRPNSRNEEFAAFHVSNRSKGSNRSMI